MKKEYVWRTLLILSLFGFSVISRAVIMEGSFNTKAANAKDENDVNPTYTNFWRSAFINQPIADSFWYDRELASPPMLQRNNSVSNFYNNDNPVRPRTWVGLKYIIDGKPLESNNYSEGFEVVNTVKNIDINNFEDQIHWANGDYFSRLDASAAENSEGRQTSNYATPGITEPVINIIGNLDLIRDFSWSRSGWAEWGIGSHQAFGNHRPSSVWTYIDISTLILSPRDVSVPTPSSVYLLCLGLVALGWRYRKH